MENNCNCDKDIANHVHGTHWESCPNSPKGDTAGKPKIDQTFIECPLCVGCGKVRPYEADGILNEADVSEKVEKAIEATRIECLHQTESVAAQLVGTEVKKAVEAERERCAKISEGMPSCCLIHGAHDDIAAAIRASKEPR